VNILIFIFGATFLTVYGEIRFVLFGFMVQLTSQLCEVCKIVMQNKVLKKPEPEEGEGEELKNNVPATGSGSASKSGVDDGDVTDSEVVEFESPKSKAERETEKANSVKPVAAAKPAPAGALMDPLTFVLLISPFCLLTLIAKFFFVYVYHADDKQQNVATIVA